MISIRSCWASLALGAIVLTSFGSSPILDVDLFASEQVGTATVINEPPRLSFVANQSVATDPSTGALVLASGTKLVIAVSATDPNPNDTLTLSAFFGTPGHLPPGASFAQTGAGTGILTWFPQPTQEGAWTSGNAAVGLPPLTLAVHDNGAPQLQDAQTITISVGPSANVSPDLDIYKVGTRTPIASRILATEGDAVAFDLHCVDKSPTDLLSLQPSATTPLPAGAMLTKVVTARDNPVKYAFTWQVASGQAGAYNIDFICRDSGSPAIEQRRRVSLEIGGPASAPRIVGIAPNQGASAGGTLVLITGTAIGATTAVGFGGMSLPFTIVNGNTLEFLTPPGTLGALMDVEVTTLAGVATRGSAFLYNFNPDSDRDFVRDDLDGSVDTDGDGAINLDDPDSDGDGILDAVEFVSTFGGSADTDGDGVLDRLDADSDNDGIADRIEGPSDLDADNIANFRDADADGDTVPDAIDNCPAARNVSQADFDADGVGNLCDNDADNDGFPNAFEAVYGTSPVAVDTDNDGGSDGDEVFLLFTNPLIPDSGTDADGDGVLAFPDGSGDNCPATPNSDQLNSDDDLLGDACDDNDDNDPLFDVDDHCPTQPGHPLGNGCLDEDLDGVFVQLLDGSGDNCPVTPNGDQLNSDDDLLGDACDDNDDNDPLFDVDDHCPTQPGHPRGNGCLDEDLDGVFVQLLDGSGDNCPVTANGDQLNSDLDLLGDACDDNDDDDPLFDVDDHCPTQPGHPRGNGCLDEDLDGVFVQLLDGSGDNCPVTPNGDQLNSDLDLLGDACDDNDDDDPLFDVDDHCPTQAGHPRGHGCLDEDLDGVFVQLDGSGDNCPVTSNGDQRDTDGDGAGDACDLDDDNDGFADAADGCPLVPGTVSGCPPAANALPSCGAATAAIASLWPANHQMVSVGIQGVTDPDGDPITIRITSVMQDEPANSAGDGNTSCDATGIGGPLAQLRSERAGSGDGRFYHVFFSADDGRGGVCTATVKVTVPHDRSKAPIDGGPRYSSCR